MEVYKLYLRTLEEIFENVNRRNNEDLKSGKITSNFYNLFKMNVSVACIHDAKGFLDCLLMFGKIDSEEMEDEMNKVRRKFSND